MRRLLILFIIGLASLGFAQNRKETENTQEKDTLQERIEKLFEDASLWQVGENVEKVKKARKELVKIGFPALKYVLENKLKTDKTLEIRAIKYIVKEMKRESKPFLHDALEDENDTVRANAIYLIGEIADTEALGGLFRHLREEKSYKMKARIISALGKIKDTTAVDTIIPYLKNPYERIRISAADALGKLKDRRAETPLLSALKDTFFTVRYTAGKSLSLLSPHPVDTLISLLKKSRSENNTFLLCHLIRILGDIGDSLQRRDSLDFTLGKIRRTLARFLSDSSWAVRAFTVEALRRFPTEGILLKFKLLLNEEEHPLVRNRLKVALGKE